MNPEQDSPVRSVPRAVAVTVNVVYGVALLLGAWLAGVSAFDALRGPQQNFAFACIAMATSGLLSVLLLTLIAVTVCQLRGRSTWPSKLLHLGVILLFLGLLEGVLLWDALSRGEAGSIIGAALTLAFLYPVAKMFTLLWSHRA